jgi:universal stress protein E
LYANLRQRLVDERSDSLAAMAEELRKHVGSCDVSAVWGRSLHDTVANAVVRNAIDLVVIAPEGGPGTLPRSLWQLVTHCPAPVLVVHTEAQRPYRHIIAAVDPYHVHGKPPALDSKIIRAAEEMSRLSGAETEVLHCFTPITDFVSDGYEELPIETAEQALESARRHALEELVAQQGIDRSRAKLVAGKPGEVLVESANKQHADLIVMGTVSHGMIRDFFVGSTAEKVLEEADCDVLIIKPPGFEVRISV